MNLTSSVVEVKKRQQQEILQILEMKQEDVAEGDEGDGAVGGVPFHPFQGRQQFRQPIVEIPDEMQLPPDQQFALPPPTFVQAPTAAATATATVAAQWLPMAPPTIPLEKFVIVSEGGVEKRVHRSRVQAGPVPVEKQVDGREYCDKCSASFTKPADLKRHKERYCGVLEYKLFCPICNQGFHQKPNLQDHLKKHEGVKPYKCDICDKSFQHKSSFSRHKSSHTKN